MVILYSLLSSLTSSSNFSLFPWDFFWTSLWLGYDSSSSLAQIWVSVSFCSVHEPLLLTAVLPLVLCICDQCFYLLYPTEGSGPGLTSTPCSHGPNPPSHSFPKWIYSNVLMILKSLLCLPRSAEKSLPHTANPHKSHWLSIFLVLWTGRWSFWCQGTLSSSHQRMQACGSLTEYITISYVTYNNVTKPTPLSYASSFLLTQRVRNLMLKLFLETILVCFQHCPPNYCLSVSPLPWADLTLEYK